MKRPNVGEQRVKRLKPSALVQRFAALVAESAGDKPILDVACGSGRNANVFFGLGCDVICIDKDLNGFRSVEPIIDHAPLRSATPHLCLRRVDLMSDPWPFGANSIGGILNVHFLLPALFPFFEKSLKSKGYLLLETVSGCGGNYVQLPKAGEIRSAFEKAFDLEFYKERKVGPEKCDAVTVQLLAKRRTIPA